MTESVPQNYTISIPDYKGAIAEKKDLYVQFHAMNPGLEALITKIIHLYLEEYDILYLKDCVLNVTRELVNNAIKANIKRLYFKKIGLDILKIEDYRQGMETFKEEAYQNQKQEIFNDLEQSNLIVRLSLNTTENDIHINVINNIPILDAELAKIKARTSKAYKYEDISEAFEDVLDDSEGAGLGLIMGMMLVKNSGLEENSFQVYKKNNFTVASLSIPQKITPPESKQKIADEITKEVESIPAFPPNILQIQKLCNNPDSTMKDIADAISRDPGLTSSILKLANSAGYITAKKVDSIEEAVKIIGIRGINTLLVATGVHKIIDTKYKKYETLWKDSYKRAFYAQKVSIQLRKNRMTEFAYLAALLSDLGKIVMISIKPDLVAKLKEIAGFKGISDSGILEEISLGISHSALAAIICRKWHFNENLTMAIELHHRPHMVDEKIKELVYIVYLADLCVEIESRKTRFEFADEDVLEYFRLTDPNEFTKLHEILIKAYNEDQQMLKNHN